MSAETNKATVRRYFEQVLNNQRHDLVEEFLAENIELHGSGLAPGLEVVKQWLTMFASAFPDGHYTIDDVVAEADRVVARTTFNGTQQGQMQGIPATGKRVSVLPRSRSSVWTTERSPKAGWFLMTWTSCSSWASFPRRRRTNRQQVLSPKSRRYLVQIRKKRPYHRHQQEVFDFVTNLANDPK